MEPDRPWLAAGLARSPYERCALGIRANIDEPLTPGYCRPAQRPARFTLEARGMKCPRCQHENEKGAKFCEECPASLAQTCAGCGRQLSATARFCPECARPTAYPRRLALSNSGRQDPARQKRLAERIIMRREVPPMRGASCRTDRTSQELC